MMQSIRKRRRHTLPVNAEINLTNLIDVAFVLLIIFMITAPILQGGIELELPKGPSQAVATSDAIVISVTKDQRIFLDKTPVTLEEFPAVLQGYMGQNTGRTISLKGDQAASYGRVIEVFAILQSLGHTNVNILLEPAPPPRRP
jgi:biopolymer transport protein TolR